MKLMRKKRLVSLGKMVVFELSWKEGRVGCQLFDLRVIDL